MNILIEEWTPCRYEPMFGNSSARSARCEGAATTEAISLPMQPFQGTEELNASTRSASVRRIQLAERTPPFHVFNVMRYPAELN